MARSARQRALRIGLGVAAVAWGSATLGAGMLGACAEETGEAPPPGPCIGDCGDASNTDGGSDASPSTGGNGAGGGGGQASGGAMGGGGEAGAAGGPPEGTYQTTLEVCWLDPSCHRALVVSHGGDWDTSSRPFLSRAAFDAAVTAGANAIEADIRVTADSVPVVAHSSPIEYYESLDCGGQRIEEMTAAEVTQCHLLPSQTETIQRLDGVLDWADGRIVLELDVKLPTDLAPTIATIIERAAEDRVFIMVTPEELTSVLPTIAGWDGIHYMARIGALTDLDPMLQAAPSHGIFLFELDRSYAGADEAEVATLLATVINPAGVKGFTSSDQYLASVQNHLEVYHQGFDVVLSYDCPNGVEAAAIVNLERGYGP